MFFPLLCAAILLLPFTETVLAQETPKPAPAVKAPSESASSAAAGPRISAAAKRNENVAVFQIDTNAVKESNVRVGATPTVVMHPLAESQWFAAEFGRPASEVLHLRPLPRLAGWHGEAFWNHQNSVFNARTFFQVGGVKPSHQNALGARVTGLLPFGSLTANFGQGDIRGMVNGNVLVPLASERTPVTTDPVLRPIVQSFLNAYPDELPNRPDFDIRALNTNSRQRIDNISGTLRLDVNTSAKSRLFLSHSIDRQRIRAFQLVAGQNPNTELHTHRSRVAWELAPTAVSTLQVSAQISRTHSALLPEPNAVGPRVRFGFQIEELGPDSMFPIDRVTQSYRVGAAGTRLLQGGRHSVTYGGDVTRFRLDGIESGNLRGYYQFTNNFGRSALQNLLLGTPSIYEVAIGDLDRGYRNWMLNGYIADRWAVHPRLQLYLGLRYNADFTPTEVQRREVIPYDCDCNNVSPRVSLAWQAGRGWTMRAMYTTTFGQILPVTYQQIRNNPPLVNYVIVQNPSLSDPLAGLNFRGPNARYAPTWLSPDLATPYSHQYNFTLERRIAAGALLRTSYIGSRTFKPLNSFIQNRAGIVDGIPTTLETVDLRRPDPRYYDTRMVVNGGAAWFDAGQVALDLPMRRGILASASYTFSKALDEGPDFSATAANRDLLTQRSQWQDGAFKDRKGLSNFDSPHALQFSYAWQIPVPARFTGFARTMLRDWQLMGVNLWKKGTPLTLFVGSDSPGFGNVDGGPSDRPNILDTSILGRTIGHPNEAPLIVSRDKFSYIRAGELGGNLGRNTFRKSRIWNWNASVVRQFRLPSEWVAQFRGEAFNLTNTPQFDEPQRNLTSPAFGKITNTLNDGRVFQLGLRLLF